MRKNFGEKFLKQIKCVFPQAYNYAWEKVRVKFVYIETETCVFSPTINRCRYPYLQTNCLLMICSLFQAFVGGEVS